MNTDYQIPEPFLFNPLKHHIGFIKDFINANTDKPATDLNIVTKDLKHIGNSVMDIYTGSLSLRNICCETGEFLRGEGLLNLKAFKVWAGTNKDEYKLFRLSDGSEWTFKYHENPVRYIHFFPARNSKFTFRVKSNTLKSALIYLIIIGKDFVTGEDLNTVRSLLNLSPVRNATDTEAVLEMIEILRD
jgi:hypothetical protein